MQDSEATWGQIGWAALRSILAVLVIGGPIAWLVLENVETIRSWIPGLAEHGSDAAQ